MDIQRAVWRTSTRSTGGGDNCVQVADLDAAVGVRDSKNPDGGAIRLTPAAWARFAAQVKAGDLDL